MSIKINDFIESQDKQMYITENPVVESELPIDCGEGINIMNIPKGWLATIENLNLEYIRTYPHTPELKSKIAKYWQSHARLEEDCIFITEGSMDGIRIACRLFLERGDRVLGNIPTFNAAESEIKLNGAVYEGVQLETEKNFIFDCDEFLRRLHKAHQLVFIDNPNNPTGQVIPLEEIRRIVSTAAQYGIGVVIDEAYGDYMDKENSAVNLLDDFENVVVLRTFSKGFGLAGMRIGYMVVSSGQLARSLCKVTDPYSVSSLSRLLAVEALDNLDFLQLVNKKAEELKCRLLAENWQHLIVSATGERVPIMVLRHENPYTDLVVCLAKHGIKAISGKEFDGLGANSVRFRIPREMDLEEVICALRKIDEL